MSTRERGWPVPVGLAALSAIPVAAGLLRLVQLSGGATPLPADPRFSGFPLALVAHIIGSATFALVGIVQLVPRLRRRHLDRHRRTGRVLVAAGLVVAGSGLWLTLFYAAHPGTGPLLLALRLLVGSSVAGFLLLGIAAARRHDVPAHRAWMIRAYALALGAGTQAFTEGIGGALLGTGELRGDLYKAAGWLLNLAVAEALIRRPGRRPAAPGPARSALVVQQ
ncbi:DUF2306 domain-containing protein [Nocardioides sp. YIM 152588]|uniref:DUF2306 domain-containing protein n=1 Tax=Nocardioides sp. YIM 152588 TaxID=3158259 RepID=UPI0032E3794A